MTFLGGEWNHPQNHQKTFKSIGFTCKNDNRVCYVFEHGFIFYWFVLLNLLFLNGARKPQNHTKHQKVLEICVKRTHRICDTFDVDLIWCCFSHYLLTCSLLSIVIYSCLLTISSYLLQCSSFCIAFHYHVLSLHYCRINFLRDWWVYLLLDLFLKELMSFFTTGLIS